MPEIKHTREITATPDGFSLLEQIAREGARTMLQAALEAEIEQFVTDHARLRDEDGHRLVVRNGYKPERSILTGLGPIEVKQPRVDDRKLEPIGKHRFSSAILPRFMRRAAGIDALIPLLYLQGVSSDDFPEALSAILGEGATAGLSASTVVRLKQSWSAEYEAWRSRDLTGKRYVYIWADGVYCNVRLEDERSCILVIIGANSRGEKEVLAVSDGFRESSQSWRELLLDLKARGLETPPSLAVGDGALGFWSALAEVYPQTNGQRCWVHKTANVLDKLPKSVQGKAKSMIHDIYLAPTKEDAQKSYRLFQDSFEPKYPKAVECLRKDEQALFSFFDFPAEHWIHVRTTNPIESTFATVRLRTAKTKGCGTRAATLSMVWKLCKEAEKSWRRLTGYQKLSLVIENKRFVNGELSEEQVA